MRNWLPPLIFLAFLSLESCNFEKNKENPQSPTVMMSGAMKNVMWKGELHGTILLDTIVNKESLIAVGPMENLLGEVLVLDGESYISQVLTDSTMRVEKNFNVKAPFLVYARVREWEEFKLPDTIKTLANLEKYIDDFTQDRERPFAFKLTGIAENAVIHILNLPRGKAVSSPTNAHTGLVSYSLTNEEFEIGGFFSTSHQGIFTHHDSFLHMHLITADKKKMGHLDKINFRPGTAKLYLDR